VINMVGVVYLASRCLDIVPMNLFAGVTMW